MKYVVIFAICLIAWFLSGFIAWVLIGYAVGYRKEIEAIKFFWELFLGGPISILVLIIMCSCMWCFDWINKRISKLISKFIEIYDKRYCDTDRDE